MANYVVEICKFDSSKYSDQDLPFKDSNIYQTYAYGNTYWGKDNIVNIKLSNANETVSYVQVRIRRMPILNVGIAYIRWGPLWQTETEDKNYDALRFMISFLKKEFAIRKGLFLRIFPNLYEEDDIIINIFKEEGFKLNKYSPQYRTILMNLSSNIEDIRKGLRKTWRQTLAKAERKNMKIVEGNNIKLIESALQIYEKMHKRKKFVEFVDMTKLLYLQRLLPKNKKLITSLCLHEEKPVAALVWCAYGDTGLPLLAATSKDGLKTNASYLLFWHMILFLKRNNYKWCNLGGINPERNRGGFIFKSGLAGNNGIDVSFIGQFDYCSNLLNIIIIRYSELIKYLFRNLKFLVEKIRRIHLKS
jgi:lipid II:glycine glycyltransferase (peptidoglycan interpeptide bridge formation enzyme)